MKKFLSCHKVCRIIIISGTLLILFPFNVRGVKIDLQDFVVFFNAAALLPLLYPLGSRPVKMSLAFIILYCTSILVAKFFMFRHIWFFLLPIAVLMSELAISNYFKMRNPKMLFFTSAVWSAIAEYARLLHLLLFLACSLISALSFQTPSLIPASLVFCTFLSALGFAVIYTGRLFISCRKTEAWIKKNASSASSNAMAMCKDTRVMALYEKILSYMSRTTSYLEESFDLEYLTRAVGTNKVYLSRTINLCSGQNFRRFLNSYRIKYAIDLMQKDKRMKFKEVAAMSGFHTQVSFDMAFKSFTGMTPSEYMENFREPLL